MDVPSALALCGKLDSDLIESGLLNKFPSLVAIQQYLGQLRAMIIDRKLVFPDVETTLKNLRSELDTCIAKSKTLK